MIGYALVRSISSRTIYVLSEDLTSVIKLGNDPILLMIVKLDVKLQLSND